MGGAGVGVTGDAIVGGAGVGGAGDAEGEGDSDEERMKRAAQKKYEAFNKMHAELLDPGLPCTRMRARVCVCVCVCTYT